MNFCEIGAPTLTLRSSTVAGLDGGSYPPAIARVVLAIVVDAIEPLPRRRIAHIGVEIFKLEPPLADGDTSAPIIAVVPDVRVEAAPQHGGPTSVGVGGFAPAGMAVLCIPLSQILSSNASATC